MIWTILGISVAILAVFSISVAEILIGRPVFENHREYISGALAAAGVAAWFVGRFVARQGHKRGVADEGVTSQFVLFDLRYWGPMLLAFGIIALFIRPLKLPKNQRALAPVQAAPRQNAEAPQQAAPPAPRPVAKAPAVFPHLKLQGLFIRQTRPFAIINGQSYAIGDHVQDEVILREITRSSVVVELSGEVKLLTMN